MDNIYQRINAIQQAVSYVKKDAEVGFGSNTYTAVTHDAVLSKLREQFIDKKIIVVPRQRDLGATQKTGETAKGKDWILFRSLYDIYYVCADNPSDLLTVTVEGHGEDINDKADGKALSYACKMANLKLFLLATGDNDEARMEEKMVVLKLADYKKDMQAAKTINEVKEAAKKYNRPIQDKVWSSKDVEEAEKIYHARSAEFTAGN